MTTVALVGCKCIFDQLQEPILRILHPSFRRGSPHFSTPGRLANQILNLGHEERNKMTFHVTFYQQLDSRPLIVAEISTSGLSSKGVGADRNFRCPHSTLVCEIHSPIRLPPRLSRYGDSCELLQLTYTVHISTVIQV